MPAIITTPFRISNAAKLISSVVDNQLYLTVGKSDDWASLDTVIVTPVDSQKTLEEAKLNIVAMRRVETAVHVIPRVNWTIAAFKEWDASDSTSFVSSSSPALLPCYCVNVDRVYKCVAAKKNATTGVIENSTTAPTHTSYGVITSVDGYSWAYISGILPEFDTRVFVGISSDVDSGATASTTGRIYGYRVVSGGTGYTNGSAVTITGDGSGATATLTTSGGVIKTVSASGLGTSYTKATVSVAGGTGAVIEPLVAPALGFGYSPVNDLAAYYVGCSVELDGAESVDLTTDNDYRQIGLLLNPTDTDGDPIAVDGLGYASGLKSLSVPGPVTIPVDSILYQASTGALAFVDTCDGTVIKYHQNYSSNVNFKAFAAAAVSHYPIGGTPPGTSAGVATLLPAEYKHGSGDLIFLENRRKVTRSDSQSEQVKVVIQF